MKTERTSAVGARRLLHPGRFLRIEESHRRVCGLQVDCCALAIFTRNLISVTGETSVPLPLALAAYCTLLDSVGGLKLTTYCTLADSSGGSKTRGS